MISEIRKGYLWGFSSIDREEVTRKFSAVTDTSFWVRVTWVYEIVKIHQTQHLKSLHLLFMHIIPQSNDKSFYRSSITFYNNTQSCIKWRWGIFFTPSIGRQKVAFSSGCVTWAFLKRKPIGLMNLSYLGGFRVKPSPTKHTSVTFLFHAFLFLFPVRITTFQTQCQKSKCVPKLNSWVLFFLLTPRIYWQEWGSSIYTVTAWGESDSLHLKQSVLWGAAPNMQNYFKLFSS